MTSPRTFTLTASDGLLLAANAWPVEAPRGVVQLTHGMGEHVRRYAGLASALNAAGWTVVGQDHRGHGASIVAGAEPGVLGEGGWAQLVDDIGTVLEHSRGESSGPVILLGHSMGSFAAQQFIARRGRDVDGVVLTGTAAVDLLEPAIDFDAEFDLALFNGPFAPARTDFDWLSRDEAEVDRYIADPLCGFGLDGAGLRGLFEGARPLAEADGFAGTPSDLPIYIAVGDQDPVNAGLALAAALNDRLIAVGASVTFRSYPGARHELTNETNKDEVADDLVAWLDETFPQDNGVA